MADGEGTNVNIQEQASGTQTQSETTEGAGNGKPKEGSGEGTGTEKGGSGEGDGEGALNPDTGKPWTVEEWRDKFRNSAKGAQDLLTQKTALERERDDERGKVTKLEKDLADLRAVAEGKNPEGLKAADVQAQLKQTSEELALIKEGTALDQFERTVPLATGSVRESLKSLARANPTKSLQELYDANLKSGAEAVDAQRKKDDEARKKGASDQGKGTSTREPASTGDTVRGTKGDTGLSLDEFNALPVGKRAQLIAKYGL